jgi:hypothetical protein
MFQFHLQKLLPLPLILFLLVLLLTLPLKLHPLEINRLMYQLHHQNLLLLFKPLLMFLTHLQQLLPLAITLQMFQQHPLLFLHLHMFQHLQKHLLRFLKHLTL